MKKILNFSYLSLLLILLSSSRCQTDRIIINASTTRNAPYDVSRSTVCGGQYRVQFLNGSSPDPSGKILSGFETEYRKGADPFPCNTLIRKKAQGVFNFDLTNLAQRITFSDYQRAEIVFENYEPIGGQIRIIRRVAWGGENFAFCDGCPENFSYFKLRIATTSWESGAEGWLRPSVETRDFSSPSANQIFNLPLNINSPIDVTQEIRTVLSNGGQFNNGIFGFVIEPWGPQLNYSTSNTSLGLFTITLRVTYRIN